MAYLLDEQFVLEIQSAFLRDQSAQPPTIEEGKETLKKLFKNHKKTNIKYENGILPH